MNNADLFPYTTLFRSAYSIVIGSKHITLNATGGGQKAASGGIQGDVLATDNNTVGMGDAGIKSAIQGSNVPNPDEAVPSFVSGAMRSEERFSRNAETDLVCRLLLEKKKKRSSILVTAVTG